MSGRRWAYHLSWLRRRGLGTLTILTTIFLVLVRVLGQLFLRRKLVLETVVNDEGWLVNVQMGGTLWRASKSNCVIDQSLIALVLDQVDMLLRKSIDVMVVLSSTCRGLGLRSIDSVRVLLGAGGLRSTSSITFAFVLDGVDVAAAVATVILVLSTTLLIVNKLFVLIEKALLELIVGLGILDVLLGTGSSAVRDNLLELLVGRTVMSHVLPLDSILTRSNELVWISTTELRSVLTELVVNRDAVEGLIVGDLSDWLQVRGHLLSMEVDWARRRCLLLVLAIDANFIEHRHVVVLLLHAGAVGVLTEVLRLHSTRHRSHIFLGLRDVTFRTNLCIFSIR